jgi:hypothetical protein
MFVADLYLLANDTPLGMYEPRSDCSAQADGDEIMRYSFEVKRNRWAYTSGKMINQSVLPSISSFICDSLQW